MIEEKRSSLERFRNIVTEIYREVEISRVDHLTFGALIFGKIARQNEPDLITDHVFNG